MHNTKHTDQAKEKISNSLKESYKKNPYSRAKQVRHIPTGNVYNSAKEAALEFGVDASTVSNHCRMRIENQKFEYVNYEPVQIIKDRSGNKYRTLTEAAEANGISPNTVRYHCIGKPDEGDIRYFYDYEFIKTES